MRNDSFSISFIGSGNVATQLALSFEKAGHNIQQIYSTSFEHAKTLALNVKAEAVQNIKQFTLVDFIVIAINDDAISSISKQLSSLDSIILHTSGSVEMNALSSNENYGVFYPLQTLSKNKLTDFSTVPVLIEGNSAQTLQRINILAQSLSNTIQEINSEQRKSLHLAAVVANNFTNHLFTLLETYCQAESIDFDLLRPLIQKTITSTHTQTGPAKRGDLNTINTHSKMLTAHPELKNLYAYISNHILAHYGH